VDHSMELMLEPYVPGQVPKVGLVLLNIIKFKNRQIGCAAYNKLVLFQALQRDAPPANEPEFTIEEVSRHHTLEDLWMILDGGVYDLSKFAAGEKGGHPGGFEILVAYSGSDGTAEFDFINHSKFARRMLQRYRIGRIKDTDNLLNKEDQMKHILGEDIVRGKRRTTVQVQEGDLAEPAPMRNSKSNVG